MGVSLLYMSVSCLLKLFMPCYASLFVHLFACVVSVCMWCVRVCLRVRRCLYSVGLCLCLCCL